jgi:hypothetical protein
MKPFTQIAIPHDDVVQGRLTMDVFAADLWQVAMGKAPVDYQDPDLFFRKTYETIGLKNILSIAKSRLEGKSGDSVIQLQTPFGGGKTHTLIALYHKAKEWGAKVVVIDGTALDPKEKKLWEELERQLTGKIAITKGDTPPGKEKLVSLLSSNAPVLILMDEVLEYITKSAGIKVGDSNLSAQTLAFLQELTGAVATTGNTLLVLTLPSSILEHFDENAEKAFQQLQKITGRVEKIYTPVQEDEIEYVVRARLFSKIDENEAKKIVDEFVEYAKNEGLLSENEVSEYRNKFLRSYPFKPEVIDVLYKRWGSFPNFQRTRGVLRLLSIVVHELLDKHIPYIRLGDFDLNNKELRRELIKHIGQEWDSIIAQDITSPNAGAKRVDSTIGASYTPYKLGSVVSTTLFMMSFSGRGEREISVKDVKLSVVYPEITSSLIDTVINNLKEKLFYLSDEGLFFTNQPNLNRILLSREENITDNLLYEKELELLKNHTRKSSKFQIYIHPKFSKDVPDTSKFKLVILNRKDAAREFIEKCGETPRVYRNTLIFLCADEPQKHVFYSYLRKFIALKNIESDTSLQLNEAQKKKLKHDLKSFEGKEYEELRKYYNKILLPLKDEFKEIHLGIPIVGESDLENEVYENLRGQGEILEKISPKLIKDRYLSNNEYVEIEKIYETFLKTAGEIRLLSKEALEGSIREGVKEGFFGLGSLENEKPICKYFQKVVEPEKITTEAIIINSKFCKQEEDSLEEKEKNNSMQDFYGSKKSYSDKGIYSVGESSDVTISGVGEFSDGIISVFDLKLILKVPYGKFSELMKIVRYLNDKSNNIDIKVEIQANNVKLSSKEVKEKIEEAALQSNIEIEKIDIN